MKELSLGQLQDMIDPGNLGQQLLAEIVRARKERDAAKEQASTYRRKMIAMIPYLLDEQEAIDTHRTLDTIESMRKFSARS